MGNQINPNAKLKMFAFIREDGSIANIVHHNPNASEIENYKSQGLKIVEFEVKDISGKLKPKYIDGKFVESATKEEIKKNSEQAIKSFKESNFIKEKASKKIENILPQYKQMNLLREKPDDYRFALIDDIRNKSNELEEKLSKVDNLASLSEIITEVENW